MRIAILECDQVPDPLRVAYGSYSDMIRRWLDAAAPSLAFQVFDCQRGDYPEAAGDYDLFVTTGSRASVCDGTPWIERLADYLQHLERGGHRLFGICFGHQLIARARGGQVERAEQGWGVGVATNRVVASLPWMAPAPPELNLLVSHQDQVTRLPETARLLVTSDFCPHFMVQWDDRTLSIQGHPEWVSGYSAALLDNRRTIIPELVAERARQSLGRPLDNGRVADWLLRFAAT